ncbi:hypothetical protein [Arenimonas daejeonensis]|uniref:hypothetical protein n=1 Tax=Arenimonas daejeonensis TaxID=370777 RepID=UPI0011BED61F|nr:hypothetical protein [Arenimonas daejeonensis]
MTQPQDPRTTPLQDDEVELARVLRALPAGEPSAKVDAAILAAATDAVNSHSPTHTVAPRRVAKTTTRWLLPSWAIGTAAAAVLAVGIGMQLRPPLAPGPAAEATAPAAKQELPQARERMSVELVEPEAVTVPPPAPPPSAPDEVRRKARAPAPPPPPPVPMEPPAAAGATAEAFPAEAAAEPAPIADSEADNATLDSITVTGTRVAPPPESGDRARRAHQNAYATRAQREALEAEAKAAQAREQSLAEDSALSRQRREAAADTPAAAAPAPASPRVLQDTAAFALPLPPVADDAALPPAKWIERIRDRLRLDDHAGARASLQLFLQTHPDVPVPADLDPLR